MSLTTHQGGCHCGAVRYHVELDLTQPAITCNCSICLRTGAVLAFVSKPAFTLDQGEDNLSDYQFNHKVIHHLFCKTCGVRSFARGTLPDGTESIAINVRCIDGVELDKLALHPYDGKSI